VITNPGENHKAVKQMIAIIPPSNDVKMQVDLGRGKLGQSTPSRDRHGCALIVR
jgi:hypothetical protein